MTQPDADHFFQVAKALCEGRLIPFLGAGVNASDRPAGNRFRPGSYLPSGRELTEYLAAEFRYPDGEELEIKRVSEYVSIASGPGALYEQLREVFDNDYPAGPIHRFLAELPKKLTSLGFPSPYSLILTTNYDDVMERALSDAGEEYDVVVYLAEGDEKGKFKHVPFAKPFKIIQTPNEYKGLPFESSPGTSPALKRTVLLKVHGAVDRLDPEGDSYVITEDNYIDYLARTDIGNLLPATLLRKLKYSHLLFLGYSMRDWNLRVLLNRIWYEQKLGFKSWAVQHPLPSDLDVQYWREKKVEVLDASLDSYIQDLANQVVSMQP